VRKNLADRSAGARMSDIAARSLRFVATERDDLAARDEKYKMDIYVRCGGGTGNAGWLGLVRVDALVSALDFPPLVDG
jgi:hypothetical protein